MSPKQLTFTDELRQAIRRGGKTQYRISKETGISEGQLSRFMHGQVGLSLSAIDRLCECLGLRLAATESSKQPKRE